jgi:predicted amidohydrolase YtcJ
MRILPGPRLSLHHETAGPQTLSRWRPRKGRQACAATAGTDMARPFSPMINVWGMATRGTRSAGISGPCEHAIDVATALRPYTLGTAELLGEAARLGSITPG